MEKEPVFKPLERWDNRPNILEPGKISFPSGATGSKIPRVELIPWHSLARLAQRFELGIVNHGDKAWNALSPQECLRDKDWVISRAAHAIVHGYRFIHRYSYNVINTDDDAAAIMWAGSCLCSATEFILSGEGVGKK